MTARPSVTVLSVLRTHPLFCRLWVGALVSGIGDIFSLLALPWYVLDQTGRGDLVGALLLCFALPAVITGPLWGRANRFQSPWSVQPWAQSYTVRAPSARWAGALGAMAQRILAVVVRPKCDVCDFLDLLPAEAHCAA